MPLQLQPPIPVLVEALKTTHEAFTETFLARHDGGSRDASSAHLCDSMTPLSNTICIPLARHKSKQLYTISSNKCVGNQPENPGDQMRLCTPLSPTFVYNDPMHPSQVDIGNCQPQVTCNLASQCTNFGPSCSNDLSFTSSHYKCLSSTMTSSSQVSQIPQVCQSQSALSREYTEMGLVSEASEMDQRWSSYLKEEGVL